MRVNKLSMPNRQLTTYQAVISQARAFRCLKNFINENLKQYGLTMTEWLLVGLIIDSGNNGIRLTTLAQYLDVELPVVTNLVNRAEKEGWVKKETDSNDKRAKLVRSTKLGGEKACYIEGELKRATNNWMSGVDADVIKNYLFIISEMSKKKIN